MTKKDKTFGVGEIIFLLVPVLVAFGLSYFDFFIGWTLLNNLCFTFWIFPILWYVASLGSVTKIDIPTGKKFRSKEGKFFEEYKTKEIHKKGYGISKKIKNICLIQIGIAFLLSIFVFCF